MGLGKNTLPTKVYSSGGYWAFDSDQETPNTQSAIFTWDDNKQLHFEVRGLYTNAEHETRIGNFFYGTEGWMHLDINGFQTYMGRKEEPGQSMNAVLVSKEVAIGGPQGFNEDKTGFSSRFIHRQNFISALRSRNAADSSADILEGHLSSSLCHLANISYRLRRELRVDPHSERFLDDTQADGYLRRNYRPPYVVPEKV